MVVEIVKTAYDDVISLAESGQRFMDCLRKDSVSNASVIGTWRYEEQMY